MTQKRNVTGAAATVMTALVVSRVTGLVRQMLIPSIIGTNAMGDAYEFSFKITDIMFYLLVGGSIASALIPVLTGYIVNHKEKEGWRAVSTFMNTFVLLSFVLVILGIIFAPQLVPLIVPEGANGEGFNQMQIDLVVDLTRILLPSVGIMMMTGMLNGILNSYHRFSAAAYGPSLYNILSALSIIFLSKISVQAIATGVLCSSFAYFLFQLSFALKNMKYYRFGLDFKHEGTKRIFSLAVPSMISSSIAQINVFITSLFTTIYPQGSLTALTTADRVWQTPYGIFAQGMGIAILPTISENHAAGDDSEYKRVFMKGLRTVLFLTIPSCLGLVVLRSPLIALFKFTERFDGASMAVAENCLLFYTIALLAHSTVAIFIRGFYALNDTKTPLYTGVSTIFINIGFAYIFQNYSNLGVGGMALAYSIAGTVNAILLIILLNKKVKGFDYKNLTVFLAKTFISALVMAGFVYVLVRITDQALFVKDFTSIGFAQIIKSKLLELLFLLLYSGAGAVVYFVMMGILKAEEASDILKLAFTKIKTILHRNK
ncbi:MAG: murein biosynthesis integral membrane protein MurJ [Eubacteriales bacterium]|nr:murein biosynthesis integral membrane protein MurJ [Eubacteriales bacterium]